MQKYIGVPVKAAQKAREYEDRGTISLGQLQIIDFSLIHSLPDVWVNESERHQLKTKVVHLSKLPKDTALLLDPNIYR